MLRDWRGRNILKTGATRGMGRCLAGKMEAFEVKLTLVASGESVLTDLAGRLSVHGTVAYPLRFGT